jgi:hypothetical protein
MKTLLTLLVLVVVVVLIAHVLRRGARDGGYRRRFENRYRRDARTDPGSQAPVFIFGLGDSGAGHQPQSPAHGTGDCGAHASHSDGGASGCGGSH